MAYFYRNIDTVLFCLSYQKYNVIENTDKINWLFLKSYYDIFDIKPESYRLIKPFRLINLVTVENIWHFSQISVSIISFFNKSTVVCKSNINWKCGQTHFLILQMGLKHPCSTGSNINKLYFFLIDAPFILSPWPPASACLLTYLHWFRVFEFKYGTCCYPSCRWKNRSGKGMTHSHSTTQPTETTLSLSPVLIVPLSAGKHCPIPLLLLATWLRPHR